MERPVSRPDAIQHDPSFAARFHSDAIKMDRKFRFSDAVGLQGVDQQTLVMYLGLRQLREEAFLANNLGFHGLRGFINPTIHYIHRLQGVRNPYQAARDSYEASYSAHIANEYPEEARQRVYPIQSSVNDLILRFSVRHEMRASRGGIAFDMWVPRREIVEEWGNHWRERLSTQREAGL